MTMLHWALIALAAFIAIWFLFIAPAEKRHHERKLEALQKKIDKRQHAAAESGESSRSDEE